jgi:hypothetical protein
MTTVERNELGATNSGDWFSARSASFSEQFSEAVSAVGLIVARSELLANQIGLTLGAAETVTMVRLVSVQHSSCHNRLGARFAFWSEEIIEALDAILLVVLGHETIAPDFS